MAFRPARVPNLLNAPANHPFTAMIGAGGLGVVGGVAGGVALNQAAYNYQQSQLPGYAQDMTAQERALYDASITPNENPLDYLQYQGTRQALMGDLMSSADVDALGDSGYYTDRAMDLISDIHNWGSSQY